MDRQTLDRIGQAFGQLSVPLVLLDEDGLALVPRDDRAHLMPGDLAPGEIVSMRGARFLAVTGQRCTLSAPEGTPDDVLLVAEKLVETLLTLASADGGALGTYRRMLLGDLSASDLEAAMTEHRIPAQQPRCVLVLRMAQVQGRSAGEILEQIVPLSADDVLVPMDVHTVALVKCTDGLEEADDLRQLAAALQETALGETGLAVTIGIGEPTQTAAELCESYRQARKALEIGCAFRPGEGVYAYSGLLLERLLSDLPPETAAAYHSLLFNRRTARLFTEELLDTVEMFFKKDLNLSDTARQLYIHRNTLVYRLDKVQRLTGLDLRRFDDAMTFRLLYELKHCASGKNKNML